MKKLMTAAVMLTAIVCTNANAASVATHRVTYAQGEEFVSMAADYESEKIAKKDYEKRMSACSDSGNIMCSSFLGLHYYYNKEYRKASPLLMKSQGRIQYPNGRVEATSELYLGELFRFGLGVMQSNDAAIEHYRICATLGDKHCAMGMASSYGEKALGAKPGSPAFQSGYKNMHAWTKVAQGLGMESHQNKQGETIILSEGIPKTRGIMVGVYGERFANDADDRASEICSKVTGCIQ